MSTPAPLRPAATTILVRDGAEGLEVWLMERSRQVGFMPAAWVFPGGRVDPADEAPGERSGVPTGFWTAAVRELAEEAAVVVDAAAMRVWAHWITPEVEPRRYDTWFFVVGLPEGETPVVDGGEAVAGAWFRPQDALDRCVEGKLPLAPPTMRTLMELAPYVSVDAALAAERRTPPIMPCATEIDGVIHVLLPGDPLHPSPDAVEPPFRYAFAAGRWWAR